MPRHGRNAVAYGSALPRFLIRRKPGNNFIARQPMGRFGTAEEIAQAALYLVSPSAEFVTGVAFAIDGGLSI